MQGTILLVDSEALTRRAVAGLIDGFGPFRVVGQAGSAESALDLLRTTQPAILITEVSLPGMSGIELAREIHRRNLPVVPVILSRFCTAATLQQSFAAGAIAYISKSSEPLELQQGIEHALRREEFVSQDLAAIRAASAGEAAPKDLQDPLATLSAREREIFHLLAGGITNLEIAKRLFISPRTVETHRARLVRKLGIGTNSELIRFAIRHGLSSV